jgi:Fe-S oxidoreductase
MTSAQRAIKSMIEQIDAPVAAFFISCVHCGMCADACVFYTETQDPKFTPIVKLQPMRRVWKQEYTFWGKLLKSVGLSKPISDSELSQWEELLYDSCTLCGRCSMVCPMGNDITYMLRKMREAMAASGYVPAELKTMMRKANKTGSPMGISLHTLKSQIKHAQNQSGLTIPLDKSGVDYLLLLSSAEITQFYEIIPAIADIFHAAKVSWTLSSHTFEATNVGVQIGSSDFGAQLVQHVFDAATELQVKYVITPECGHAYTALRWEGPNLIKRAFPFKVVHILEVLDTLQQEGRIHLADKETDRLTYQDPCQLARRGGVIDQPRRLLNMIANNFIEMEEHGSMSWCCGGGGGVSSNERADRLRSRVFNRKKQQLDDLKVRKIVTACSNCRNVLEDGLEQHNMDIEIVGLTETIAKHLALTNLPANTGESS